MKIREQKAWKSKRNGRKERMNPKEKALKSKHQLKPSVTIKQVTTERRMVKVRGLSRRNENLTRERKWDLLEGPKGRFGWGHHPYTLLTAIFMIRDK